MITIDSKKVSAVRWIPEKQIAVSSGAGTIQIFELDENNLTTTLVKEFKHRSKYGRLEWNEKTHFLASGDGDGIKIWSMDRDDPIHSLPIDGEISGLAWCPCIRSGEEDEIEKARKSAKNYTLIYASSGVSLWNPLENEKKPRLLSDGDTFAFSSDGAFLAEGGRDKSIIWSSEHWRPIYTTQYEFFGDIDNFSWLYTTTPANFYEHKFIVNNMDESSTVLEFAFEESKFSDTASQILKESKDEDVGAESEVASPSKRLKASSSSK
ncbi:uncharacterized protein LOC130693890 [Daphnia carinata]|uniref:uncharacterized protein LOC130693890 n=1 Tax=Daphnia carinata TaxID=120202 RepID=UPI00257C28B9|nr:uncharacterized protein LOC130693890 [Daphnia carinata]XP_057373090.1 uncharacterized protein LOC130693890 [Daphnia carinata]